MSSQNVDVHFTLEMQYLRLSRWCLYSMCEDVMFYGVPRYMCSEGKVSLADENHTRLGARYSDMLLRTSSTCEFQVRLSTV